jgi:hypothetical protein
MLIKGKNTSNNKDTGVLFIFISYLRLVILLLRAGRHGKIVIEKRRRDSEKFGDLCTNYNTRAHPRDLIVAVSLLDIF